MFGVGESADVVMVVRDVVGSAGVVVLMIGVVEMRAVVVEDVGVSGVALCVLRVDFLCEMVLEVMLGVMKYRSVGSDVLDGSSEARNFWRFSCSLM